MSSNPHAKPCTKCGKPLSSRGTAYRTALPFRDGSKGPGWVTVLECDEGHRFDWHVEYYIDGNFLNEVMT